MAKKINREEIKAEVKRRQQNAARDYTEKANLIAAGYKTAKTNSASGSAGKKPIGASNSKSNVLSQIDEIRNDLGSRNKLSADALMANNPAYVYTKAYGDGKTGAAANRPVKGTATPRSRFEPADTGRPLGRASAQRAFTSTPTGNFKGEAILKSALSSSGAAYKKLGADVTSPTGNLSMGESARAAINEAKTAKKEGRQVRPGQAQRKAEQEKIKSFNDGWAGDFKQKLLESAEESSKRAHEFEQEAKQGLGKFGQGVVDFGIAGAQFAGDALLNAVAPGTGIAAMAGRAYGSASLDAQQRGLSEGEQQISGLKSAAIEVLTEKLFGSVSKVAYGKGIIRNESLVNSLVNRLAKTDRGRTALKVLVGANEEGMEEVLSDILNPIADRILKLDDGKGDWSDLADDYDTQQMLEDYIIGGALGLVGAGTNIVSGQYRAENAQQRAYEEYQRQLVNAGLATEQGGDAQLMAEKYKSIIDQSTQRGKRNLSDKETENLERLIRGTYAQEDASDVSTRLAQLGTDASEQTVNAIVKAVNGETLSRAEQKAFDANPYSQRVVNEMLDTEGVTSNEWYADRASAQSFTPEVSSGINIEQAQNVLDTSTANNPQFVNSMARQYEVAPEVVERTYNLNPTAPQAFETAFNAVYQMGQQGTDKAALGKVPVLSTAQANIAYQMGADSVMSTETAAPVTNNNTQEVNDNGVRIYNVAKRINGQNTEGQIRGVETGTGENVAGGSQKEQGGAGAAQIKAGEKVSYKGKQQKGVYYAAEDTEGMKKGRKLAESYGYKVTYFVGGNIRYAGGEFRGAVDTAKKTVMVRADHPDYTAEQIMRHEMGHAAFENGDLSLNEAKEMLLDDFAEDELNELIEIYSSEYGGILSPDEAFEEICCDALGRMNIFEGTDLNSESYGKAQDTVRKYAAERTGSKGRAPPKKSGEMYSLEPYSNQQIENWKNSKRINVYENSAQLDLFVKRAIEDKGFTGKMFFGVVGNDLANAIETATGYNFTGRNVTLRADHVRKIFKDHGSIKSETARGQRAITANDFTLIPDVISEPEKIKKSTYNNRPAAEFIKVIDGSRVTVIAVDSGGSLDLYVQTMYASAKKGSIARMVNANALTKTPETTTGTAPNTNIPTTNKNVNKKFSREPERLNELRRQNERKLAQATAEDAANENERGLIRDYQKQYSKVEDIREKLSAAQQALTEAEDSGADYDTTTKAKNRFTVLSNQYAREHRKLESYAKMKALQNVLTRVDERLGNDLPEGMGAASANFTGEETVGERWVTEAQGEGNSALHPISKEQEANLAEQQHRAPQEIPKKDLNGKLTSKHVSTIANSGMTPAEFSDALREDAAQGKFSHIAYSDEEALKKAERAISDDGWDQALANYKAEINSGRVSKDNTVMGIALYNNAVNSGDYVTAMDIASLMVKNSTNTAQSLQAMRILNKLSPECRLYLAAKSIENIEEDLNERYKDNKADIHVDKILYDEYAKALRQGDEDGIKTAWANIEQSVAQQINATWYEKLNNFRYLAMLGNPRTHVRNIVGNAFFVPVRAVKNTIAYGLENIADAKMKGGIERSKAILNSSNAADAALVKYAMSDYEAVQEVILSGGKYVDTFQGIDKHRTIYKTKILEAARKGNSAALDAEDAWFCKPAYANALAKWYKANGISAEQLNTGKVPEDTIIKAQTIAIKEAQKATYRDTNWFSAQVSRLGKVDNKVAAVLIEGVLPFKKTPANILARAVEYSPVGLIKSLALDTKKVKAYVNGDIENGMSPAEFIDDISAGLTGSALMGLGILLASWGVLSGGDDDDEKQNYFDELSGKQNYALSIGGMSITLDWLAPESMPLFVGVELFNSLSNKNEDKGFLQNLMSSVMSLSTPMFEMSMLQSVNDLFDNLAYIKQGQGTFKIVSSMAANYISQYFPTLFGQTERSFEEAQRETTYIDRNSKVGSELQYMWGKIANKIPFYDFSQIPYIDAWGRTEETGNLFERMLNNFVNPAYVKKERPTEIDGELERLYDLGETSVYPSRAKTNTKINGEYLTADEYVKYATTKGQTSYELAQGVINSAAYSGAADPEKAYMLKYVYSYADHIAKYEVNNDYSLAKWEMAAYKSTNPMQAIIDHAREKYNPDKEN